MTDVLVFDEPSPLSVVAEGETSFLVFPGPTAIDVREDVGTSEFLLFDVAPQVGNVETVEPDFLIFDLPPSMRVMEAGTGEEPLVITTASPGPRGPIGRDGIEGPKGDRGFSWFWGYGPPFAVVGSSPGDKYLDVDTGNVFVLEEGD